MDDTPLERLRAALHYHEATCPLPTLALLLHPSNLELLGVDHVEGVPVRGDERVPPGRFRIDCEGSTANLEDEVAEALGASVPA